MWCEREHIIFFVWFSTHIFFYISQVYTERLQIYKVVLKCYVKIKNKNKNAGILYLFFISKIKTHNPDFFLKIESVLIVLIEQASLMWFL